MTKRVQEDKEVLIGMVGVDSGQLVLCDPCYIDSEWVSDVPPFETKRPDNEFSYGACCERSNPKKIKTGCGQINYKHGHPGVAVVSSTGFGDGIYPVTAVVSKGGRVRSLTVTFFEEGEV